MFEKDELRLLWPFYASMFVFMAFFIFMPYWIIFYKEFLSFTQISVLMAIMFIAPIFFEVPTGVIADLYGRKFSTLLGYFSQTVLMILLTYVTDYAALVIIFILFGVTSTLFSGAENAWVVDWLIYNKKQHLQKSFFRKRAIITNVGQLAAAGMGIVVVKYLPFSYIWFFSGIGLFVGGCIMLPAKEHFVKSKAKVTTIFHDLVTGTKEAFLYTCKKKELAYATLFLSILYGISGFNFMSWDVQLRNNGLPVHLFGLTLILNSILGIIISMNYHKLTDRIGHLKSLVYVVLPLSLVHVLAYIVSNPFIFLVLLSCQYSIWNSYYYPVSYDYLHKHYSSKLRATLESITNLITMATLGACMVVGGILNDLFGPRIMILVVGIGFFILFVRYFISVRSKGEMSA